MAIHQPLGEFLFDYYLFMHQLYLELNIYLIYGHHPSLDAASYADLV